MTGAWALQAVGGTVVGLYGGQRCPGWSSKLLYLVHGDSLTGWIAALNSEHVAGRGPPWEYLTGKGVSILGALLLLLLLCGLSSVRGLSSALVGLRVCCFHSRVTVGRAVGRSSCVCARSRSVFGR